MLLRDGRFLWRTLDEFACQDYKVCPDRIGVFLEGTKGLFIGSEGDEQLPQTTRNNAVDRMILMIVTRLPSAPARS